MPHDTKTHTENPQFWLTVPEAAEVLGIKRRRMLDYRDKIACRRVDNPRSGKSYLMFERSAVEAFRDQRELAKATGLRPSTPENGAVPTVKSKGDSTVAAILQQALALGTALQQAPPAAVQQAPPVPAAPPLGLFLDLDQASAYAGLSRRLLRSMIEAGQLPAWRDGRTWKIRRTALREIAYGQDAIVAGVRGGPPRPSRTKPVGMNHGEWPVRRPDLSERAIHTPPTGD